jgi:DHA3 family multidrug efflux protein-like MFS transporter
MALMDAYGLSLMSVQAWGLLWGALSTGFILGGLAVAKTGLGKNPVRLCCWSISVVERDLPVSAAFVSDLADGWHGRLHDLIPYAEAAEQTILQRSCRSSAGPVFGFAQSVEQRRHR